MSVNNITHNPGNVVSVRGSVVDKHFTFHLPAIFSLLHTDNARIAIHVLTHMVRLPSCHTTPVTAR